MQFRYTPPMWVSFPQLVPVAAVVRDISAAADTRAAVEEFSQRAAARLDGRTESELAEIQAWRRAFSQMGLKPTPPTPSLPTNQPAARSATVAAAPRVCSESRALR